MESMVIVLVLVLVYGLLGLMSFVQYVLYSASLMGVASRVGAKHSWLAWIPVANYYVLGGAADALEGKRGISHNWRKILLFLAIGVYALLSIFVVCVLVFAIFISVAEANQEFLDPELLVVPAILFYVFYFIMLFVAVALSYLNIICTYKIFEEINPKKSIKHILISMLVPFGNAICLFRCKKMIPVPVSEPEPAYVDPGFGYDVNAVQMNDSTNSEEQNNENDQQ